MAVNKKTEATVPENQAPLAVQETPGAVVTAVDQELAALIAGDSGLGKENITAADMALPRLAVLQALSKQVQQGKVEYRPDAKPGMIYDNVLNNLYSGETGMIVVPVSFRSTNLEWIPVDSGGGFVADHGASDEIYKTCEQDPKTKAWMTKEGHEIVKTAEYFVYIVQEGGVLPAVISLAKTGQRVSRSWNTMINSFEIPHPNGGGGTLNPAMFYRHYKLTTGVQTNKKGQSWFTWKVEPVGNTMDLPGGIEIYKKARKLYQDVASGAVKVAAPAEMGEAAAEDDAAPM